MLNVRIRIIYYTDVSGLAHINFIFLFISIYSTNYVINIRIPKKKTWKIFCSALPHILFLIGLPRQSKTTKLVGFLHSPIFAWAWSGVDFVRSSCSRGRRRCRGSVPCRHVAIEVCWWLRSSRTLAPLCCRQENQMERKKRQWIVWP